MSPRTGLLSVLVPDETTRRAFDETLADWREEWQRASTPMGRLRVSTRGWISIARLVTGTIGVGWSASETWAVLSMAVLVSAVLSLLMIPSIWWYTPGPLTLPELFIAVVLVMPQGMATLLAPVAAIGFGAKPWREPNVIAVAPVLALTMVLLTGWVFPASNQMYREHVFSKLSGGTLVLTRGVAELSAPELVRDVRMGSLSQRRAAVSHLSARLALVVAAPVFFIFGAAVRRQVSKRTRWGVARFMAGASAVGVFLGCSVALSKIRDMWPGLTDQISYSRGLSIWLSSLVLCLATLMLTRISNAEPRNETSEPGTQEPGTSEPTDSPA